MGTSGNPAKKAAAKTTAKKPAAKKASTAKATKSRAPKAQAPIAPSSIGDIKARRQGILLEMPSGLIFRCRRVDLQAFLASGTVVNPLMEVINDALKKGQEADIAKMVGVEDGEVDLQMVNDMFNTVKNVVCNSVAEPKIHQVPEDEDDRDDDLVYIDDIDEEDMMFIFQWAVGGTADLETFRQEARASLASVAEGQGHWR